MEGTGDAHAAEDEAVLKVSAGTGVLWEQNEEHETRTEDAMLVLILEVRDPELGLQH